MKHAVTAALMVALSLGVPAAPAIDIDRVQICKTVDSQNHPIDTTTVFIPSDAFFCSIHARSLPAGTPMAIHWYCSDHLLKSDRFVVNQDGEANLYFEMDPPDEHWKPGAYRAELLVNDAVTQTLPFSVSADPSAEVVSACLCRDIDHGTLEPVEPTDTFGPKDRFWCSLKLDCPTCGEDVGIKWLRGGDLIDEVHTKTKIRTTHYMVFLLNPKGPWAPGDYQAQLLLEGQAVKTLTFKVQ